MPKWWHVRWKSLALTLLIVFAALWTVAGAVNLVLNQLSPLSVARTISQNNPALSHVPAVLPDKSLSVLNGARIECLGFTMQTPWMEIDYQKNGKSFCSIRFKSEGIVAIFNQSELPDFAEIFRSEPRMVDLLGQQTLSSNYALKTAAMAVTPDQVKWWRPRSQNARNAFLLAQKSMNLNGDGTLYAIATGRVRGFQEGSPSIAPYKLDLNLFDESDRSLKIMILAVDGHGPVLSQAELNAMVASIKPIPNN